MTDKNRAEEKDRGGRPFKFDDPEKLQISIDRYFADTPQNRWTITGLALDLDCDMDTLRNYEANHQGKNKANNEVIRIIKRAKLKVQNSYELDLREKSRVGDIFVLKNFGWADKREIDHTSKGNEMKFTDERSKSLAQEYEEKLKNID